MMTKEKSSWFWKEVNLSLPHNSSTMEFASKFISSEIEYEEINKLIKNMKINLVNLFLIYPD